MDFDLSEEHRLLQQALRSFVDKEVGPRAAQIDEAGDFPWDTLRAMGPLGYLGLNIPEEYGGAGADSLSVALLLEQIGRHCGSTGLAVAAHVGLGSAPLLLFGTEEQKQRWLRPLAQGKIIGCLGLTEPDAGSDLRGVKTTAVRDGDEWVINGSKMWLTNGAESGIMTLYVRTGERFSQVLVPTDTPGVHFGPPEKKMGLHGSHTYAVSLEDVRVPAGNLLGREGHGLPQTLQVLDGGRVGIASLSLGLAQGAYEAACSYANERFTFGRPLAQHQAIAFMVADMATKIQAARWLVYHAAWLKDQGRPYTEEASMAKLFASEIGEQVARDAIQIHGGYGYSRSYAVERIYRDVRLMTIGEGTSEIQRMVIARHVL
jgi:alkylation response protein AidB-like acyl-CoA dehydrogenase